MSLLCGSAIWATPQLFACRMMVHSLSSMSVHWVCSIGSTSYSRCPYTVDVCHRVHSVGFTRYSIHVDICSRVYSIWYSVDVHYLHVLSTIWSTLHLFVVVPLSSGHTYLPAISTAVYCWSPFHSSAWFCFIVILFLCRIFCHSVHCIAACLRVTPCRLLRCSFHCCLP